MNPNDPWGLCPAKHKYLRVNPSTSGSITFELTNGTRVAINALGGTDKEDPTYLVTMGKGGLTLHTTNVVELLKGVADIKRTTALQMLDRINP